MSKRSIRGGFTLIELLVVIGIIAIMLSILLPTLSKVRAASNLVVCASNVRQLTTCMLMYEQDYKGALIVEWTNGPLWTYLLKPYVSKVGRNQTANNVETRDAIFSCPAAWEKPSPDSVNSAAISPFEAFFTNYNGGASPDNGFKVQAAYGMNRYIYDAHLKYPAATWNPGFFAYQAPPKDQQCNTTFWKLQQAKMGQIPMLMDCRWREVYVDKNTEDYYPKNTSGKGMALIATRRHGRATNVAFTDLSVRTVQLPELWSFRWRPDWTPPAKLPPVPW